MGKIKDFDPWKQKLLDIPVGELNISRGMAYHLKYAQIKTVRELTNRTPEELLRIHNFGKGAIEEIRKILKEMGLYLLGNAPLIATLIVKTKYSGSWFKCPYCANDRIVQNSKFCNNCGKEIELEEIFREKSR